MPAPDHGEHERRPRDTCGPGSRPRCPEVSGADAGEGDVPDPVPISDMRFWTRKVPIIGANTPTARLAISARCMNCRSKG
jgi:hypothetical protein